ncbi:MAG: hypothetical protein PGN23_14400 [Sphingomonas adhaesiva]|uniref:hypothetical protein n=1 Tax=Sphingomonas adhaesiva TaxID=28212 RepID=UPI002FFCA533
MSLIIAAGLLLGAAGASDTHQVRLDHRGQRVDVTYRHSVDIRHEQVGAAGAPGRPTTLRCRWNAAVDIHREARHAAGHVVTRRISADAPVSGSRPGWCAGQRDAIARDVAAASGQVRDHLMAVAARDQDAVLAELDAAHDRARS